jgi:uncharacterized protein (DUF1697 family)
MPVWISFLRGINVGGNNLLPMAVLKELYAELGFEQVHTVLQSGNAVFVARKSKQLAQSIEHAIEARCEFRPRVMLRSPDELRRVALQNPFPKQAKTEPQRVLVHFLERAPAQGALEALRATHRGPEQFELRDHTLYVYFPEGAGKSKLTPARMDKALGVQGTARNWNTLTKLIALAEELACS